MPLIIRSLSSSDQVAARQLILAGLGEHFGWIDQTCNPDLDDIMTSYIEPGRHFIVAEMGDELVGAGALITVAEDTARIMRVSVSQRHRRQGIGRALVAHLLDLARRCGFTRVLVSTEPDWQDAIGFYQHCGFTKYKHDDVGAYFSCPLKWKTKRDNREHF